MRAWTVLSFAALAVSLVGLMWVPGSSSEGTGVSAGSCLPEEIGLWVTHPLCPDLSVCFHPDTDPRYMEEYLSHIPSGRYVREARWTITASGSTGSRGNPIKLTYSIVPDGTNIQGEGPSDLIAKFNLVFPSEATWRERINNALNLWAKGCGITYTEDVDDGSNLPTYSGVLGVRGDVRISGVSQDGVGNVLAYSWYPDNGDMVIDTDDRAYFAQSWGVYRILRNLVSHEHGHGHGLGHVIPTDCTKLMEPYLCTSFLGPQDDDIRGSMRNYGDPKENDDTAATAYSLGTFNAGMDSLAVTNLCTDAGGDIDWFKIVVQSPYLKLNVTVDPVGSGYNVGPDGGTATWVQTDEINNLEFGVWNSAGTVQLVSVSSGGLGVSEVLTGFDLPSAGTYLLKVSDTAPTVGDVQRYTLIVTVDEATAVAEGALGREKALGLSVYPNPFNPNTTARFFSEGTGTATLEIYDVLGKLTRRIDRPESGAGWVEMAWDGRNDAGVPVASGVYLLRVSDGEKSEMTRIVLLK
jgi:hypothetical protein